MGSGEVSACLPGVLVGKPPLAGGCSAASPSSYGSLCVPGIPSHRNHRPVFLHLILEFIRVRGAGFPLSLHAMASAPPNKPRCSARRVAGVCSAVLFCLHGSIMHSQNNSAQLAASFLGWRVLRHCLVSCGEPVTATSACRQPSALKAELDLVISADIAITSNHLQRSDRQSIWAKS